MEFREPLPEEEQKALFENLKVTNDPCIKEKIILHNLRLVLWVARKYNKPGINELDDLFQVGVIGLIRAIKDYDPNKGAFSSYAVWWIKQSITRDIANHGRIIRVPVYMVQEVTRLIKVKSDLTHNLGREPTPEELSVEMGLDIDSIEEILTVVQDPISLHTIIGGEDEDLTLEDSVPDDGPTTEEIVEDSLLLERFKKEVKPKLTDLQYNSLNMYYGLDGAIYTLQEIADKYDYKSREYIRSQRDKALRIIRTTRYYQELKEELEERTSYIRGVDYTQPRVKGGLPSSPVENIILIREEIRERLQKKHEI